MAAFMQVPVPPHRKERHFRLKDDLSLNLSNEESRERYRFGREGIMFSSNLVSNDVSRKTKRNHALTVPQQVMAPSEDEPSFVNWKGVHSVNVQAVSDARGKFTNINANWPGSSHDSHIFRTSQIRMTPGKACKIIIACAILQNICILFNEPDIEDDGVIVGNDGDLGDQDGRAVRDHISTTFCNH
ncbi:HARBI1 [Mytilus coruscus]|uniref:HARBI1 n=1 Tax=Mytilus coruscus TaxID=42192 RepID=A0A6J8B5B9_MYTCO|nr:HARBI1 [Mytilus coruscus]